MGFILSRFARAQIISRWQTRGCSFLRPSFWRKPESREAFGSCFFLFIHRVADPGLLTFSFTFSFRRTPESRVAGGRPAAGYFRLRGQKKVAKEKAAPGSPPLAWCPCAARQARRLWNSLSNLIEHIERADSSDSPRRIPLPCLRLLGVSQGVPRAGSVMS